MGFERVRHRHCRVIACPHERPDGAADRIVEGDIEIGEPHKPPLISARTGHDRDLQRVRIEICTCTHSRSPLPASPGSKIRLCNATGSRRDPMPLKLFFHRMTACASAGIFEDGFAALGITDQDFPNRIKPPVGVEIDLGVQERSDILNLRFRKLSKAGHAPIGPACLQKLSNLTALHVLLHQWRSSSIWARLRRLAHSIHDKSRSWPIELSGRAPLRPGQIEAGLGAAPHRSLHSAACCSGWPGRALPDPSPVQARVTESLAAI